MQKNNNKKSLDEATNTKKGTTEQGALKTIHREYNKLNGFEAMLHIVNRFRFVLYPFIFLSIAGSSYSFYNDFLKSFPMNADYINLAFAIFLSVMLEIVRDGALIALFVKKMGKASRLLVVGIFLSVTTYMYSSHLQAIKVIEEMAVEYTLAHQDTKSVSINNPEIAMTEQNLKEAKQDLKDTKKEYAKQLDISANAKYKVNKDNAQKQLPILKADKETYKADVAKYQAKLLSLKNGNIQNVKDSQKIISKILLSTLILIESLAMLGAVIKFIHSDNAKAEIAKHSEIIEEYVELSEQMKTDNEELTKNLSNNIKAQSESNQMIMKMISDDMRETAKLNIGFIEAIAENKRETMQQMNQVLQMINKATVPMMNATPQVQAIEHQEPKERQIGFVASNEEDLIKGLFQDGYLKANDKLTSKTMLIDVNNRSEDKIYKEVMRKLSTHGIVEFKRGHGYYATETKGTLENALRVI